MTQAKYNTELSAMGQSMKLLLSASLLLLLVQGALIRSRFKNSSLCWLVGCPWRPAGMAGVRSWEKKCAASSVDVEQTNTGEKVGYDPVFEVTVRNRCGCALRAVHLRSEGFASSVAVDPRLFRREGRDYLVGDGRRIESKTAVRFRYAWDRAFKMVPASVQDDCS